MKANAEVPVHTVYYKFSLTGALIVLLDPQSGCTGKGSAVVLCNIDLGGSAGEQAALVGNVGALLILCSPGSAAHEVDLSTGTSSGTSSLWSWKCFPVAQTLRWFLQSVPLFSVATSYERGVSVTCLTMPGIQVPLAGLKTRTLSSGISEKRGCWAVLSYCAFCMSCLSCSLTLMSPSVENKGFDTAGRLVW